MTPSELKMKSRIAASRLKVVTIASVTRAKRRGYDKEQTEKFVKENIERYVR